MTLSKGQRDRVRLALVNLMIPRPMSLRMFFVSLLATAFSAAAQDTRKVEEPKIPRSCTTLKAALKSVNNTLAPEDETKLDTDRIQKALDHCKTGMAVELRGGSKDKNAFLSGPLEMRSGVTLLVDKGVTLYGSRDAALYEMKGEGVTAGTVRNDCDRWSGTGLPCSAETSGARRV